ncbi:MAG: hypothetical protein RLZZ308_171 [Candidatus Parcubacteria bacterium]|jgi:undecaprenyl-diphosphatase
MMLTIYYAFILGIVEGFTEFLPISSTAHLILTSHILSIAQSDNHIMFEIAIQLGAILAVVILFWKQFLSVPRLQKLALAFIPTGLAGFLIYPFIKILFQKPVLIGFMLLLGGIIIILTERKYSKSLEAGEVKGSHDITTTQALLLGCYQALAIIPGVSRSGAVIVGGLLHNIERRLLTEFTFLLAVPTMLIATLYSVYKNKEVFAHSVAMLPLVIGFFTSFIIATIVVKFFLDYIKRHSFVVFGIYRIILGTIIIGLFL